MNILVLEASTTSTKAMVYNDKKGVIEITTSPYDESIKFKGTVDTDKVFEAVLEAGKQVSKNTHIDAISICSTWLSLVVCDKNMIPQTPTYSWTYMGAMDTIKEIRGNKALSLKMYKNTGCIPHSIYAAYRLYHLINKEKLDISNSYILGQGSYIFYKLTDERIETTCMMSGGGWINVNTLDYDDEMLSMVGIKKEQLGSLKTYKDHYPLRKEMADKLGIQSGIPVIPAHPDGALNQAGAIALDKGVMTISVGTSGALRLSNESVSLTDDYSTWCYVSPENKCINGAAISGATNCIDWFINKIANNKYTFEDLEKGIKFSDSNPIFLPFLCGERSPGWNDERKISFHNITEETNISDLYYSILEGILFNIKQCYSSLTKMCGKPKSIKVSGGILNSKLWTQMLADILQEEIVCSDLEQSSLLGGAILAIKSLGKDENGITEFILSKEKSVYPNLNMKTFYKERYKKYLDMYSSAK